ncbi:pro-opiomelanocortin [Sphaerodactylus townsendi]|uniref:pro-opiomelanocortin n=1 Tax=Sphaerodactylus townsendi TaxID=933632 RepID=UPI002025D1C4|nr:pro-opiomelanocortin [Sphaerodactylus townsendi]
MLNPQWSGVLAILGVLLFHSVVGDHGHCLESGRCRDMDTEAGLLECLKACRLDLSAESPVFPGNGHMQPLSENIRKYVMSHFRWNKFGKSNSSGGDLGHKREELSRDRILDFFAFPSQAQSNWDGESEGNQDLERQERKRSYAMEHFRWGKPVGQKRRPVRIYPNEVEEESSESYPQEFRRELALEMDYPEFDSQEEKKSYDSVMSEEKEDQPEEVKKDSSLYKMRHFRWNAPPKDKRYGGFMTSERSHTPLVTLFKNAIIKTAYKKGQ